jgi:molecular chaperone DnaK (HSP70)
MARPGCRYIVGIDLGTTNSALGYVDTQAEPASVNMLELPQLVAPGEVRARPTLPSFLYLASQAELPAGALDLPWSQGQSFAVGELARAHGAHTPMRLVSSAKSWLSHAGVDRTAPLLPPHPAGADPVDVERISPLEAQARYLRHLAAAWDHAFAREDAAARLADQDVYLTVPASFDAVARELTVRAATAAGLEVTLLEEPQAAFYSWLGQHGDRWRKLLNVGDIVLVCDVGGGTTDFSLIAVTDESGNLTLERVAVGDHILLGGDNMDLALATTLAQRLAGQGHRLDPWQTRSLVHACRAAKEALLADSKLDSHPVTVLGRGRSIVGGTLQENLQRADVEALILDGFFPKVAAADAPRARKRAGLAELGLPFAADAAVTRHLAKFLSDHASKATAVLFNGGVMKSPALRRRVVETLDSWSDDPESDLQVLTGTDLDLAVAHGAAYYGLVRRGQGVRIRGGTARSYYIGVESSMPAVPGMPPPMKAICVAPMGMEEGSEADVAGEELGLVVGEPAEFRLLSSSTRKGDRVGEVLEDPLALEGEIVDAAPLEATLPASASCAPGQLVPVRLRARVTEVGTLAVWCVARDAEKWKLEFDVRGET